MKRREFVYLGSAITAGVATGLTGSAQPSDVLRLGVIGTGDRGQGIISQLQPRPDFRIVACSDVIPFRLEEAVIKSNKSAKPYPDYRALLDDKSVDAVIIAVPFGLHHQVVMDALDSGKHVYCEKTMVRGYSAIREVFEKVKATDRIFQVGHQFHSSRLYTHLVSEIQSGLVGDITLIQCQWNRNGDWRRPVPDPKWERMINWRMYREYSGGLVAELCSHQVDFCNWVTGATPEKVTGFGGIDFWKDGRETYDNVHILADYPAGVKASFTSTTINSLGDYQIKVLGRKGALQIDYDQAWFFPEGEVSKTIGDVDGVSGATVTIDKKRGNPIAIKHEDPTLQALLDFRESIVNNREPASNVVTGGHAATVVQMALDAMDNQRLEAWKEGYRLG